MDVRSWRPLFVCIFAVAAAGAASAQRHAPPRFQGMDRDGDGVITRAEWRGSDRSFRVHDWNGDGVLSGDEVRVGVQRPGRSVEEDDLEAVDSEYQFNDWTDARFRSLDRNHDNRISRDEWHFDRESFRRADHNGNGVLTRQEFLGSLTDDDRDDRFAWLDVNRDGRVSRDEWHGSRSAFEMLDSNRDGVLSRVEMTAADGPPADLFARLDSNRDGVISRAEWFWSQRSFDQRDTNRDGQLSRAELSRNLNMPAQVDSNSAYQRGCERGDVEGSAAGREDRERNQGWDLEGQRELESADSGYQSGYGPRAEYQAGYRACFRTAYRQGWNLAR